MIKQFGIIFCASLALLMINYDMTAMNIIIPKLMENFSVSSDRISIVILSYLLGMTGTSLLFGKVADRIGHGRVFFSGYLTYLLASLLSYYSWDLASIIIFRFIQGLGGAMIFASSAAIIFKFLPGEIRGRGYGFGGMMAGTGFALGSPVGAYLTETYGYNAIFLFNIPLAILGMILCLLFLRGERIEKNDHRLDKLGAGISLLFFSSIVILLQMKYSLVNTISLVVFTLILFLLFFHRGKMHVNPILDFKIFKSRSFTYGVLTLSCYYILLMGNAFIFPIFLSKGKGYSVSEIGILLFIYPIISLFISPIAGWLTDKVGAKVVAAVGILCFIFSSLMFYNFASYGKLAEMITFVVYGMGLAFFMTPIIKLVMGHSEARNVGEISAIKSVVPNLFGMIGVGVYAILYSNLFWGSAGKLIEAEASAYAFSTVMLISLVVSFIAAGFLIGAKEVDRV